MSTSNTTAPDLASPATIPLGSNPDLARLASQARDAGLEVMLIERPMPDAVSLVAVGRLWDIVSGPAGVRLESPSGEILDEERGGDRVAAAARLWRRLCPRFTVEASPGPPGTGPMAVGGFAFDPAREPGHPWLGFPGLLFRIPELTIVRSRGRTFATEISPGSLALLDPSADAPFTAPAAQRLTVDDGSANEWLRRVQATLGEIHAKGADKVVLARTVRAEADGVIAAGPVATALRASFPSCYTYLVAGADGTALVGSSPELLLRRRGRILTSQPMAGSIGRGADEVEDEALAERLLRSAKDQAEHSLVPDHISTVLARFAPQVDRAPLEVVRLTNIQHLATTISASLADESGPNLLEIAADLHPTPAVAGHPTAAAQRLIGQLEGLERGWYAGAVGWIDSRGDGELAVTLRCGLLDGQSAQLYAGCGIMSTSDPEAELAETRLKLDALLAALTA